MPELSKPLAADIKKKSLLHAVLFNKELYTPKQCKDWLKKHKYSYIHNRDTTNMHRFRIREVIKGYKFYTITLPNKIELVYMYK